MSHFLSFLHRTRSIAVAVLLTGALSGCITAPLMDEQGRVYHCVGMTQPIPPPNTWAKTVPVEKFEYGNYQRQDTPTVGGSYYCNILQLPKTAYLRYRLDGRVIEKHFDLSALTARRVHQNTVEFFVNEDVVEVRLVTRVPGNWPIQEVITRQ